MAESFYCGDMWYIWKRRCSLLFYPDGTELNPGLLAQRVSSTASDIAAAFAKPSFGEKPLLHIAWKPPDVGFVKLNTDGASLGNPGVAGAGGVIRDASGDWLVGFMLHLGVCSNMVAEMEAARFGLSLAWDEGYRKIVCEMDALVAIELFNSGDVSMHPLGSIIADIRELRRRDWECSFVHTLREDQFCASSGAKVSLDKSKLFLSPKARSGHARLRWELA